MLGSDSPDILLLLFVAIAVCWSLQYPPFSRVTAVEMREPHTLIIMYMKKGQIVTFVDVRRHLAVLARWHHGSDCTSSPARSKASTPIRVPLPCTAKAKRKHRSGKKEKNAFALEKTDSSKSGLHRCALPSRLTHFHVVLFGSGIAAVGNMSNNFPLQRASDGAASAPVAGASSSSSSSHDAS